MRYVPDANPEAERVNGGEDVLTQKPPDEALFQEEKNEESAVSAPEPRARLALVGDERFAALPACVLAD